MDASDYSVSDHSSTHRARRNELREHVGKRELRYEAPFDDLVLLRVIRTPVWGEHRIRCRSYLCG